MTTTTTVRGFTVRRPTPEDAQAVCDLIAAYGLHHSGMADPYVPADILEGWSHLDPEMDVWLFYAPDGHMAAYGEVTDQGSGKIWADNYVHPDFMGRGLGTELIRLTEARARELVGDAPEGARVTLGNGVVLGDAAARELLERAGYRLVRVHWRMGIELAEAPEAPAWPDGITLRTFERRRDERAVFEAVEGAFADHWGHVPTPYEDWAKRFERPDFDPSLWFLALDGDEVAGIALCRMRPQTGWVGTLAVRRPWRKRGLGAALLRQSFRAFWERGVRSVGLGVDSQNLTGAVRLYEQAGMRPLEQAALYEKELRAGEDLSTRELAS